MQCAGYLQPQEQLRKELHVFAQKLKQEVLGPALLEHRQLLRPFFGELREQLRQDLEEFSGLSGTSFSSARSLSPDTPALTPRTAFGRQPWVVNDEAPVMSIKRPSPFRGIDRDFKSPRPSPRAWEDRALGDRATEEEEDEKDAGAWSDAGVAEPMVKTRTSLNPRFTEWLNGHVERDYQMLHRARSAGQDLRAAALSLVSHALFDHVISFVIIANALLVAAETDTLARDHTADLSSFRLMDVLFCLFFASELSLRLFAYREDLLAKQKAAWTVFELGLVLCQVIDCALEFASRRVAFPNLSFLRILRILRLFRISRVMRIFQHVVELRTMLTSIAGAMKALFWVVVLCFLLIFSAGTFFTQVVTDRLLFEGPSSAAPLEDRVQANSNASLFVQSLGNGTSATPRLLGYEPDLSAVEVQLEKYYGSLTATFLSLYECISGGMDWRNMIDPLLSEVSPAVALVFLAYVIFASVAMMNVVTGIFVEHALRHAEEDQDIYVAKNVIGFFQQSDLGEHGGITMSMWERKMNCPEMQALFEAVNVDPSDARSLFRLIDLNDTGVLYPGELIDGWVRLRGQAKSLDLALLMRETDRAHQSMQKSLKNIQDHVTLLSAKLNAQGPTSRNTIQFRPSCLKGRQQSPGAARQSKSVAHVALESTDQTTVTWGDETETEDLLSARDALPFQSSPDVYTMESTKPFRAGIRPLRRSVVH